MVRAHDIGSSWDNLAILDGQQKKSIQFGKCWANAVGFLTHMHVDLSADWVTWVMRDDNLLGAQFSNSSSSCVINFIRSMLHQVTGCLCRQAPLTFDQLICRKSLSQPMTQKLANPRRRREMSCSFATNFTPSI